ncbi:MAG: ankyrin repeat domain-containing protein [Bacteroidales bacterium]|nr:ankyrin repeat domain-containing protein [Bacteroidales bacterium]MBN2750158.1 ankyrin repeat domain-containing protein [Bacteroidales bacterium]
MTRSAGRDLEKWKKEPCPFQDKYQKEYDELVASLESKTLAANADPLLVKAAEENDKALAEKALNAGAKINAFTNQTTPLIAAVKKNNLDMVKFLIEKGADPNIVKPYMNEYALYYAVKNGNKDICEYLVNNGANNDKGINILLVAAANGQLEIFKMLVDRFSLYAGMIEEDNERQVNNEASALCLAQKNGHEELAQYIITKIEEHNVNNITDPTHKKHINKAVYSTAGIPETGASENAFQTTFKAAEPIYGRVFLDTKLKYLMYGKNGTCNYNAEFDQYTLSAKIKNKNKEVQMGTYNIKETNEANSIAITINTTQMARESYKQVYEYLQPGKNDVTFIVTLRNGAFIFEKDVVLEKDPKATFKVGKTFDQIEAGMNDPELVKKATKWAKENFLKHDSTEDIDGAGVVKGVKILSKDWNINRHEISGQPEYRSIVIYVNASYESGRCIYQKIGLKQNYDGNSYSSVLQFDYSRGISDIDCN